MHLDVVKELGHLTLGTRLRRLGERLQAQTQQILDAQALDIQAAQFPVLAAVERLGPASVGAIAEAIGVTQPAATRALAQLAEAGLVAIEQEATDQRRKAVSLTRAGKRLVEQGRREVWPGIEAAVKEACRGLSGSLLEQLAGLEDALAAEPLERRATRIRARRR